jgi:hypothetical protein
MGETLVIIARSGDFLEAPLVNHNRNRAACIPKQDVPSTNIGKNTNDIATHTPKKTAFVSSIINVKEIT